MKGAELCGDCWRKAQPVVHATEAAPKRERVVIDKNRAGLYHKFDVRRTDGTSEPGGKHDGCSYFVLDLTHDKHAMPALRAYARSCRKEYPGLAVDLDAIVDGNPLMPYRTHMPPPPRSVSAPPTSPPPDVTALARKLWDVVVGPDSRGPIDLEPILRAALTNSRTGEADR